MKTNESIMMRKHVFKVSSQRSPAANKGQVSVQHCPSDARASANRNPNPQTMVATSSNSMCAMTDGKLGTHLMMLASQSIFVRNCYPSFCAGIGTGGTA